MKLIQGLWGVLLCAWGGAVIHEALSPKKKEEAEPPFVQFDEATPEEKRLRFIENSQNIMRDEIRDLGAKVYGAPAIPAPYDNIAQGHGS